MCRGETSSTFPCSKAGRTRTKSCRCVVAVAIAFVAAAALSASHPSLPGFLDGLDDLQTLFTSWRLLGTFKSTFLVPQAGGSSAPPLCGRL